MSIELTSPACRAVNAFSSEQSGQMGKCGHCQTQLYIPEGMSSGILRLDQHRKELPIEGPDVVLPTPASKFGHVWLWSRHKPVIALLSATLILAVIAGLATLTWISLQSDRELQTERLARENAEKNQRDLQSANEKLKKHETELAELNQNLTDKEARLHYGRSLAGAHREWLSGNLGKWE